MATTSSIGSGGGRDYSTIQAWHDAFATGGWIGECYNDSNSFVVTTTISLTGKATSATDFITLKCAAGHSFRDHASVQTNALTDNQSNGVRIEFSAAGSNYQVLLNISEAYCTLSDLQLKHSKTANSNVALSVNAANFTIENCIVRNHNSQGLRIASFGSGNSNLLRNTLFISGYQVAQGQDANGISWTSGTKTIVNCTIVCPSDADAGTGATGLHNHYGSAVTVKNCAVFGFATFVNSNTNMSGSNNCSDVAIGFGSSNQASKTYANQFVNTTGGSSNFKLKTGSDCIDTGVTDTTNIPAADDIAKTSRPSGSAWDIGCWELVQAAATKAPPFQRRPLRIWSRAA